MALVERPDPRKKLMLAGALDGLIIIAGIGLFLSTGNMMWILGAVIVGAIVSVPMLISAIRALKEQQDASR
ncbi:MAG: hypothetical protein AAFY82_07515 [Pseudomonadota bacterium]